MLHAGDFVVLLDRCEARLQDHGQRLRLFADHASRCAEVKQQGQATIDQKDVVRRNVAMQAIGTMQSLQRIEQRRQQRAQPRLLGRSVARLQELLERAALIERHHHVGGLVRFPEAKDLDQRRMIELRQQLRFVDEAAQAGDEGFHVLVRFDRHRQIRLTRRQRRWHVLLQRDVAPEMVVIGAIDDAKAAFADDADNFELCHACAIGQDIARTRGRDGGTGTRRAHNRQVAINTCCRSCTRAGPSVLRCGRKHRALRVVAASGLGRVVGAGHCV